MFQACCRCRMPHLVHRCWTWWKPQPSNFPRRSGSGRVAALEFSTLLLWWISVITLDHSYVVRLFRKDKNHSNEMVVADQRSLVTRPIWYGCHLLRRFFTLCTLWRIPQYPGYVWRLHLRLLQNNRVSMPLLALLLSSKFILWQISKTTLPTVVDASGSWEAFEQMRNLHPNFGFLDWTVDSQLRESHHMPRFPSNSEASKAGNAETTGVATAGCDGWASVWAFSLSDAAMQAISTLALPKHTRQRLRNFVG